MPRFHTHNSTKSGLTIRDSQHSRLASLLLGQKSGLLAAASCALLLSGCGITTPFTDHTASASSQIVSAPPISYPDAVDLALYSPIIVDMTVTKASSVNTSGLILPQGISRSYVKGTVGSLLRGQGGVPAEVSFLIDQRVGADGRFAKLKNGRFFAFARPVVGQPGVLQLMQPDSLIGWSPENERLIRLATSQVTAGNVPPVIGNIISGFHFPGTVQGEGETQVFLETPGGDPISLRVVSRPGMQRQWGLTLGEVVAATPVQPVPESLQFYRLACSGLPASIPTDKLGSANAAANNQAQADYQFIRQSLGQCYRTRAGMSAVAQTMTPKSCPGFPNIEFPANAQCPPAPLPAYRQ